MTAGELLGLGGIIVGGTAAAGLVACTAIVGWAYLYTAVLRRRQARHDAERAAARPGYLPMRPVSLSLEQELEDMERLMRGGRS